MVTKREVEEFFESIEGLSCEERAEAHEKWLAKLDEKIIAEAKAKGPSPFIQEMRARVDELERMAEEKGVRCR